MFAPVGLIEGHAGRITRQELIARLGGMCCASTVIVSTKHQGLAAVRAQAHARRWGELADLHGGIRPFPLLSPRLAHVKLGGLMLMLEVVWQHGIAAAHAQPPLLGES